jgi:carbamoylphosphate synthase large subunit
MSLAIYGKHSNNWMMALNNGLLPFLQPMLHTIHNHYKYSDDLKTKYDYILPIMEKHMIELHKYNIKMMAPDIKIIYVFMNKNLFSSYVTEHNLTEYVPTTYKSISEISPKTILIVKPHNLNAGSGMYFRNKYTVNEKDFDGHVIQEYLSGNLEYCAYIVAKKGKIQLCIVYEYEFGTNVYIKTAINLNINTRKIILDEKHMNCLESFLLPCMYNGVCNIDFKIYNDVIKVFEINPRLGGSLMFKQNKGDLVQVIKNLVIVFTQD